MTQPALSRLEAGGVVPTIPLLERISAALDADLIVELAPHAALRLYGRRLGHFV
jgi:transcriptional regulator with XRE-family HTH domain